MKVRVDVAHMARKLDERAEMCPTFYASVATELLSASHLGASAVSGSPNPF